MVKMDMIGGFFLYCDAAISEDMSNGLTVFFESDDEFYLNLNENN